VQQNKRIKILYFVPIDSTFIQKDVQLLRTKYDVKFFCLNQGNKLKLPFQLLKQLWQCLFHVPKSDVVICQFASYASLIPFVVGKLFRKPRLLIIAGMDAASFPEINYGIFRRNKTMEWFASKSILLANHILPVHESLAFQPYDYHQSGAPIQGFQYFVPGSKTIPFSPLYYSYDSNLFDFDRTIEREKLSFITIGNLSVKTTFVRKGFDLIIELAKLRPELNFTLIGWDGKTKFDFPDNVTLLPFMPQAEIVKLLNRHQYYFQLSLMEGFPNALAEAMLCGCIPIGSNVSGIPYIIGDTGYVLKKHAVEELNKLIDQVIDQGYTPEDSDKARNRVVTHFNDDEKMKVYQEIILKYIGTNE